MNRFLKSFISSALSIVPIIAIILVLSLVGLAPLDFNRGDYLLLLVGAIVLIVGLALFQIGANASLTKVGEYMGSSLSKQKNLFIVILFSFALGALITCAEPSILVVTKQVSINTYVLIGCIAAGVGIFVVIGVLRVIYHKSLKLWYLLFYCLTFMLIIFIALDPDKRSFLPFIFDSGGITTGSATVPFILSLGAGVAAVRAGKSANEDSFGLVGMASIGPILTMTLLILLSSNSATDYVPSYQALGEYSVGMSFVNALLPSGGTDFGCLLSVFIALAPILVIFFIYELIFIRLPFKTISKLLIGFLYTYVGLVLFLSGTEAAMTPLGNYVGECLGGISQNWIIILIAFIIGLVTILCEPAVHVLTQNIEDISEGRIKKSTVLITLSLGVGLAIALAVIRTLYNFSIMYYVVPGYALALVLMFFCPNIYTAMAFDSGGTASGPMSSSFVLPLVVGITTTKYEGQVIDYYEQSFGLIALIALIPILAIQLLGIYQTIQTSRAKAIMRKVVYTAEDAQIINF